MHFSDGRKSYLAHLIVKALRAEGLADVQKEPLVLAEIKRVLAHEDALAAQVDAQARRKIASLQRNVLPGSREWDVLYRKYYDEELRKIRA